MLRPSGYLAIADLDLDGGEFYSDHTGVKHHGFDRNEMVRLFNESEFRDASIGTALFQYSLWWKMQCSTDYQKRRGRARSALQQG